MALPRHKSFEKTHAIWLPMRPHDFPKTQLFFNTHAIKLDSTRKHTFCCCVRMDLKCYICVVYVQQKRTKNENARSAGTRVLWARWQFGAERLWIYQHPPHIRRPNGPWLFQILLSLLKEFSPPPNPLPWDPENAPQF